MSPVPHTWTPRFDPENLIYTDGFDIKIQPHLVVAVVHIPSNTTVYIYATGTEEIRGVMRAEIVAVHTALPTFALHD
jgi:hypothetical protein